MIESVLIANRGEIARRIIRAARRLGIRTVAVHSDADSAMPFVREADVAERIGPAPARESYLRADVLIEVARRHGTQAIHPGYGFLSENAEFAEAVAAAGLVWIGAPPAAIRAMGLKDAAKARMIEAGVPVTPGYLGEDQSVARLAAEAEAVGFPVLIKAVAGGGGKGMRRVDTADEFDAALESCRREAKASFGDDRVLIEKYILSPRHIEVQVFGDTHGNVVHLFERDCSLQRRHQKVIEEASAPGMEPATRQAICEAAVRAARAVDYVGAGTIEFIADGSDGLRADRIWFMEMNTRLQVEHPVTESITGQDLVEWQFRIASGEMLPRRQEELSIDGWAMEARLYAENPATGFLPSIGRLEHLVLPGDIRVDSGVEAGCEISSYYDPMIAKLIVHERTRQAACAALAAASREVEVWPVRTNAGFLARVCAQPDFVAGRVDTGFIERHAETLIPSSEPDDAVLQKAAASLLPPPGAGVWSALQGFRLAAPDDRVVEVVVDDHPHLVTLGAVEPAPPAVRGVVFVDGQAWSCRAPDASAIASEQEGGDGAVAAPMPGQIIHVAVEAGATVRKGQKVVVLEAMKMELTVAAPFDGTIAELAATQGALVSEGTILMRVEKAA
ncbi:3-methylcrotonyl-CoA carboxylase alpha subunit [Endobacter medicaginis]|uniref:3-methylcrotonyl-CoA carboxylase alpha subunit n=1 Tax=Endobacter medicaginis TaxID=1181271 RepID=A0A839V3B9_9PROT|nr:biotin carboxylase N-terminal domain-containing protein [Endobacter medicaginis]MBB3175355.1 3-methylcrotonyl-CoA carboxylase alpha subunit [Endobacter medicaginis]MCX5476535.1 ATP-grasp domain-containing protein [Endobacter medicaginis]NVN29192.1 ATP-grasp domain-containing protein [Endobacter medicaginis]